MTRKVAHRGKRKEEAARKPKPPKLRARELPAIGELRGDLEEQSEIGALARELATHAETGPPLSGGDLDADWQRAHLSGDEAVGGSVATPDQDVVDEIGRALGVEQASDAEVRTAEEVLRDRDRFRWHLEREAAGEEEAEEEERPPRRGKKST